MDLSKMKVTDWLIVIGVLVAALSAFLNWFDPQGNPAVSASSGLRPNAFSFMLTGTLPWVLLVAAAVLTVALAAGKVSQRMAPWPFVLLLLTGLATLLILVRLVIGADASEVGRLDGVADFALPRATPLYLSALGGAVATGGAFLNLQADATARAAARRRQRRR